MVKLIHAVKVVQLRFAAKMASVVMTISNFTTLFVTMQLRIMSMNVNVFVMITTQVCSNIAITLRGFSETDSPDFICFIMSLVKI